MKNVLKLNSRFFSFLHVIFSAALAVIFSVFVLRVTEISEGGFLKGHYSVLLLLLFIELLFLDWTVRSNMGLKSQKISFWTIIFLLLLNSVWAINQNFYAGYSIYGFHLIPNYLILLLGIFFLPYTWQQLRRLNAFFYEDPDDVSSFATPRWDRIITLCLFLAFIAFRFLMPLLYRGFAIDEMFHIYSGVTYFEKGHFIFLTPKAYYMRGAYVSWLVGFVMHIFGQTLFVAKMVPAFVGIANFFLLYFIARRLFDKRLYLYFFLIIYAISPSVMFNHFYIRMFVFYEFFALVIVLCFLKLIEYIRSNQLLKGFLMLGIVLFVNFISYKYSYDDGKDVILFLSGLLATYIFFFEIKKITVSSIFPFSKQINSFLHMRFVFRFCLLALSVVVVYFSFHLSEKFPYYFYVPYVPFSSSTRLKYDTFFFSRNIIFTSFFLLSPFLFYRSIKGQRLYGFFIFVSVILLVFHLMAAPPLQVERGIFYFFPFFYLVSILALSRIRLKDSVKKLIMLAMVVTIVYNYPPDFFKHPYTREIDYEDAAIFRDISSLCPQSSIFTNRPEVLQFFGIFPSNKLTFSIVEKKFLSWQDEAGSYSELNTLVPLVTSPQEFEALTDQSEYSCYVRIGSLPDKEIETLLKQEGYFRFQKQYASNKDTTGLYIKGLYK